MNATKLRATVGLAIFLIAGCAGGARSADTPVQPEGGCALLVAIDPGCDYLQGDFTFERQVAR